MHGEDFPQVIAAARLGAEWAWTALYRDLVPSVRGYVRARGTAEPDDVVGEVFLQVVRDLERFDAALVADAYADPASGDLSALRGKDVVLVFVESYGRVAVEGRECGGFAANELGR